MGVAPFFKLAFLSRLRIEESFPGSRRCLAPFEDDAYWSHYAVNELQMLRWPVSLLKSSIVSLMV